MCLLIVLFVLITGGKGKFHTLSLGREEWNLEKEQFACGISL